MARLLIIGIRNEADDQGVFEWKPITIKMRLFPADTIDADGVEALLSELLDNNVVCEHTFNGKKYGVVRNFTRYQSPKKPNYAFVLPDKLLTYVGCTVSGTEFYDEKRCSVQNRYGTGGEKSRQREKEKERESDTEKEIVSNVACEDASDDDFPEMPAFLDRRPKPVDDQPPDPQPRGTPVPDPFQQAILDGTALHPEDSSQPAAIARAWDHVRDLADTAKRLGFTPDALKALLAEKRVEMVNKGDPVTSIKFYTTTVERAAQRRNVETAGGGSGGAEANPDQSLQRLMRVRAFASNGLWQQEYGPEPSQDLQDAATAWKSSDPVPELFHVKQEGRS
jgi:hypothetical protein